MLDSLDLPELETVLQDPSIDLHDVDDYIMSSMA